MNDSIPPAADAETTSNLRLLRIPDADLLAAMQAADVDTADMADPFEEDEEVTPTVSWVA